MPVKTYDDGDFQADAREVGERFKAFIDHAYQGIQSALAGKVGISQPAISRVASGEQLPSGKLLLALSRHTDLNLVWLFTGQGSMLLSGQGPATPVGRLVVPIADLPLPGPPDEHRDLLSGELIAGCGVTFKPTQYWLRVRPDDPITGVGDQKVRPGDLILLETDRGRFPEPSRIADELWVVRLTVQGQHQNRLAQVSHLEDGGLEADTFYLQPQKTELQEEIVLRREAGKKLQVSTRYYEPRKTKRAGRLRPRPAPDIPRCPFSIKEEDLIARKILILRR